MPNKSRSSEAPKVPRDRWVQLLHRRPVRWDVLLHRLAESLVRRYWYTQAHFRERTLRLETDELWDCAIHMARAFGQEMSCAGVAYLAGKPRLSIFTMDKPGAMDQIVAEGAAVIRAAIINYLEIAHNCFLKRNHPDLELLMPRITEALRRFLADKCSSEGELRPCIDEPLGDDEGYFPPAELPPDPKTPSGNAALDAHRLNVLVHDEDDAATMMRKLIDFVKTDPFLAPEFTVELVIRLAAHQLEAQKQNRRPDEMAEAVRIRDRFLFSPCRQNGLTPVELFARRQFLASQRQKDRLEGWALRHTDGIFRVIERGGDHMLLRDISRGRDLRALRDPALDGISEGRLLRARMIPWDEQWLVSGMIQLLDEAASNEQALRTLMHPLRICRPADDDDPRLTCARELVKWMQGQFIVRFGGEIARFDSMQQGREAMAEFHHWLVIEAKLDDGRQFADAWNRDVGLDFPAFDEERFGAGEPAAGSFGIVCDMRHGMAFLPNAADVELAMTSPFPSVEQKRAFGQLLLEKWRPGWLVEKVVQGHEERAQEIIREFLGDGAFNIERDLPPLLGRLKCPDHTLPDRPAPFVG